MVIDDFKNLKTRNDVALYLGISYKKLCYMLYAGRGVSKYYKAFAVPKGSQGNRIIFAPTKELKYLQKKINILLTEVYLNKPRKAATGFIKGKSIVDNALPHIGKRCILNIDFSDFFSQIHIGRIIGMFTKGFGLGKEAAVTLAQILTVDGTLPQGAPSSPIVTNMICSRMDIQLERLVRRYGIKYTRYVDDLTFSTDRTSFPKGFCYFLDHEIVIGEQLDKIFESNDFDVNLDKVFLRTNKNRQEVTGLVVNEKCNVRKEYIKNLRAALYNVQREVEAGENIDEYLMIVLFGKIQYLKSIRGSSDNLFLKYALQYNRIYGEYFADAERVANFSDWISKRVYVVDTHDENEYQYSNGTGFNLEKFGIVSCHHVTENIFTLGDTVLHVHFGKIECKTVTFDLGNFDCDDTKDVSIIKDTYTNDSSLKANFDFDFSSQEELTLVGYPQFDFMRGSSYRIQRTRNYTRRYYLSRYIYEVDCQIEHGMSGGPVLDSNGQVVGIITNGSSHGEVESPIYGFIPLRYLRELVES